MFVTTTLGTFSTLGAAQAAVTSAGFPAGETIFDNSGSNTFHVIEGMEVQAAIDAAGAGATIEVGAGTFSEQLLIDGKTGLTINANPNTIFEMPAGAVVGPNTLDPSIPAQVAVINIIDSTGVVINDGTIDAQSASAPGETTGILTENSEATIDNVTIEDLRTDPGLTSAKQAIFINNENGTRTVTVQNSNIRDFVKAGILVDGGLTTGADSTAVIQNNVINGAGFQSGVSGLIQNGIEFRDQASGTITGNTVEDIGGNSAIARSTGILADDAADGLVITNNILRGPGVASLNQPIFIFDVDNAVVTGNTIGGHVFGVQFEGLSENPTFSGNTFSNVFASVTDTDGVTFFSTGVAMQGLGHLSALDFTGTTEADFIIGTLQNDTLSGGDGEDIIFGDEGNDTLNGGNQVDLLSGDGGDDELNGGNGADNLDGGTGEDTLNGGTGADELLGFDDNDVLNGDGGLDTLRGEGGDDTLDGGSGADSLDGGDDNDSLDGGAGRNTLTGGAGDDIFSFQDGDLTALNVITDFQSGDQIELLGGTPATAILTTDGTDSFINGFGSATIQILGVTNLSAADFSAGVPGNLLSGATELADSLDGSAGVDFIDGLGGNDTINGLGGNDVLSGSGGDDEIDGGGGFDTLDGGAGNNTLTGGLGEDVYVFDDSVMDGATTIPDFEQGFDKIDLGANGANAVVSIDQLNGNTVIAYGGGTIVLEGITEPTPADFLGTPPANLLVGTAGSDLGLDGSLVSPAIIFGLANDDSMTGGGDNDLLIGGTGNDTIDAGDGADTIDGGAGDDVITGSTDDKSVLGGDGNDDISTGAGIDTIDGGTGNDTISSGDGNDVITGGAGDDEIEYGEGDNDVDGGSGVDFIAASFFAADFAAQNTLSGGDGGDFIFGSVGSDLINGDGGGDFLDGGDGDDTLDGGVGANSLTGGFDNDTFSFTAATTTALNRIEDFTQGDDLIDLDGLDPVVVGVQGGDTVISFGTGTIRVVGVTGLTSADFVGAPVVTDGTGSATGTPGNDPNLVGSSGGDLIDGLAGDDTITGNGGDDTLNGGADNDEIDGGDGADEINGDGGDDDLVGGAGADTMDGGTGTDTLDGGAGGNTLTGGTGADTFSFDSGVVNATNFITDWEDGDQIDLLGGGAAVMSIVGGDTRISFGTGTIVVQGKTDLDAGDFAGALPDNFIFGDNAANNLDGSALPFVIIEAFNQFDTLIGSAGDDILLAGLGNDTLTAGDGDDTLDGGRGSDTLTGGDGDDLFTFVQADNINPATDTVTDFVIGEDKIFLDGAGAGAATLTYVGANSEITGFNSGTGSVTIVINGNLTASDFVGTAPIISAGGTGVTLFGDTNGPAQDSLDGGAGDDFLDGLRQADTLNGFGGDDELIGDFGNDVMNGGSGNDTLDGGRGQNTMTGGADADVFLFSSAENLVTSEITDFEDGVDIIQVNTGAVIANITQTGGTASFDITDSQGQVETQNITLVDLGGGNFGTFDAGDIVFV